MSSATTPPSAAPGEAELHVSSLVLYVHAGQMAEVRTRLADLPGVEVHGAHPAGRLVITAEDTDAERLAETLLAIHRVEGVISAALVYTGNKTTLFP